MLIAPLTVPSLSKLANNSFRVIINSSAVHLDESSVNPTMSANRILKTKLEFENKLRNDLDKNAELIYA